MMLSVIVPVYNTEQYLDTCLKSILNQTYRDLEIVCVDDGSTDGSAKILDGYARSYDRFVVMHKSNGGLVSARKAGLQKAKGKYIAYVDSDDWIEPDMYEHLVLQMEENGAQIAASGFIRDYGSHTFTDNEKIEQGIYSGEKLYREIKECMVDYDDPFGFLLSPSLCNKVFLADYLRKYQMDVPNEVTIDEDTVVTVPMIMDADAIYVSGSSYYHYCSRQQSMLNDKSSDESPSIEVAYNYMRSRADRKLCDYYELYARLQMCPETVLSYQDGVLSYFGKISKEDRIVVYGAGSFGKSIKKYLDENGFNVVAWVDKNGDGVEILKPAMLKKEEYSILIVGVLIGSITREIINQLQKLEIDNRKIVKISRESLR